MLTFQLTAEKVNKFDEWTVSNDDDQKLTEKKTPKTKWRERKREKSTHITNVRAQKIDCNTLILKDHLQLKHCVAAVTARSRCLYSSISLYVCFFLLLRTVHCSHIYFLLTSFVLCSLRIGSNVTEYFSLSLIIRFYFRSNTFRMMDQRYANNQMNIIIYNNSFFRRVCAGIYFKRMLTE